MATGRTHRKNVRVYADGYDLSGYTRGIGPLAETYDEDGDFAFTDPVKGFLPGQAKLSLGTQNGLFDNTATVGLHAVLAGGAGSLHTVTVAMGIRAAPAAGDACYGAQHELQEYATDPNSGMLYANAKWGPASEAGKTLLYSKPWGVLLHANSAETAANTAIGIDQLAATAFGGYMVVHILSGDSGTITLKVQDAATNLNASFADVTGMTTGAVAATAGTSYLIAIGRTAALREFVRWQLALGTAATCTFVMTLHRAYN